MWTSDSFRMPSDVLNFLNEKKISEHTPHHIVHDGYYFWVFWMML